jgi:hypothetical protein
MAKSSKTSVPDFGATDTELIQWLFNDLLGDYSIREIAKGINKGTTSVLRYKNGDRLPSKETLAWLLQGVDWARNEYEELQIDELDDDAAASARKLVQRGLFDYLKEIAKEKAFNVDFPNKYKLKWDDELRVYARHYTSQIASTKLSEDGKEEEIFNQFMVGFERISNRLFDDFSSALSSTLIDGEMDSFKDFRERIKAMYQLYASLSAKYSGLKRAQDEDDEHNEFDQR